MGTDANNLFGSLPTACSVWRIPGRFHDGTGQSEPTQKAGYTIASDLSDSVTPLIRVDLWGNTYPMS